MERFYSAFVSSTFLDLKAERQQLVQALLGQHCFPLGMELFPSNGLGQWPLIEESIASADFCVFMVAGRYGSICAETQTSWTQREFRAATAAKTPIIALLHSDPESLPLKLCEKSEEGRRGLAEFRAEIQDQTNVRYYENAAELINGLHVSIESLKISGRIAGWLRAGARPILLQEEDYDRTYERLESSWSFRRSSTNLSTWDGVNRSLRRVRANDPQGLANLAWDLTRDSDTQLPFGPETRPDLTLSSGWTRGSVGSVSLKAPRKMSGPSFVQDVSFVPPLGKDETAEFQLFCHVPRYKYAYAEDLQSATRDSLYGPRTFDWTTRQIVYPTRQLIHEAFLPLDLQAHPIGPMVGKRGVIDRELSDELKTNGSYTTEVCEKDGVEGHLMRLVVENPRLRRTYRLAWQLPAKGT